jgi:hypothetical protein
MKATVESFRKEGFVEPFVTVRLRHVCTLRISNVKATIAMVQNVRTGMLVLGSRFWTLGIESVNTVLVRALVYYVAHCRYWDYRYSIAKS